MKLLYKMTKHIKKFMKIFLKNIKLNKLQILISQQEKISRYNFIEKK